MIEGEVASAILIKLPGELGGGFLTSSSDNMAAGLQAVRVVNENRGERPAGTDVSVSATGNKTVPWIESDLVLSAGYRVDDFDWNIAGDMSGRIQISCPS